MQRKSKFPHARVVLRRIERYFLQKYRAESLAIRTNLRIFLTVLLLGSLAMLVAGTSAFLANSSIAIRLLLAGLFVFFPLLLWLLRSGRRTLVELLYTVVLSVLVVAPQLVDAAVGYEVLKLDRMTVQVLLQLILLSAISEKWSLLLLGYGIMVGALAWEVLVIFRPMVPADDGFFVTASIRSLVNITLSFGVLLILHQAFHRAIRQIETANQQLDAKVQQRTEQVQVAQQALMEGERLAVLGRLSASVAHEINTPLGAIQSSNTTIRSTLPEVLGRAVSLFRKLDAEQEEILVDILDRCLSKAGSQGLERRRLGKALSEVLARWGTPDAPAVADLLIDAGVSELQDGWRPLLTCPDVSEVGQFVSDFASVLRAGQIVDLATEKASQYILALRQFLHDQSQLLPQVSVEVSQSLEAVLTLLRGRIPPGVRVFRTLEPGIEVMGQPARLMQIWSNLISNALDAMGNEGMLTVTGRKVGAFVEVTVADTGPGIPEEIRDKLFDPFVTTKAFGIGTGMGLGIVRSIVEEHSGRLQYESQPGNTQFIVRLPLAPAKEP